MVGVAIKFLCITPLWDFTRFHDDYSIIDIDYFPANW